VRSQRRGARRRSPRQRCLCVKVREAAALGARLSQTHEVAVGLRRVAVFERPQCDVLAGAKPRAGVRWRATATVGAVGADCAAVLGFRSRRKTRFTHFVRCARTVAVSQFTKRARTRADRNPVLLAAAQAHHRTPTHGLAKNHLFFIGVEGPGPGIEPGPGPVARLRRAASHGAGARGLPNTLPQERSLPQGLGPAGAGLRLRRRGAQPWGRRAYPRAS
jgi:hypothetical protein